jgi:Zn-dependent protease
VQVTGVWWCKAAGVNDSTQTQVAPSCAYHPGRMTLLRCTRCDKPACHECLTQAAVGSQCKECVKGAQLGFKELAGRQTKAVKRSVKPSPIFLALLAAWVASGVALLTVPGFRAGIFIFVFLGWVVSLCLHEFAHAFTAFIGGDASVVRKGYLTLDPRKYTDPGLSLVFPLVFLLIGGIGLPGGAVWIQRNMIRTKRMESLMSLAGPLSNLLLAFLLLLPGRFDFYSGSEGRVTLYVALEFLGRLQLGAFVLNMLPIPGFDGFGALEPFLPENLLRSIAPYRQYAPLLFLFLLLRGSSFSTQLWEAIDGLFRLFGGNSIAASAGGELFRFWNSFR